MFLASRFGLVALIANGYRALAYILLAVYILPLLTVGVWQLVRAAAPTNPFKLRRSRMRDLRRRASPCSLLADAGARPRRRPGSSSASSSCARNMACRA